MRNVLRLAVAAARDQFKFYSDQHRAKIGGIVPEGTPAAFDTAQKAEVNDRYVEMMERALDMTVADDAYEAMVAKLQKPGEDILAKLTPLMAATVHMAMGISGEAGELTDAIKRWAIYGKDLDLENVKEELGDIEFFLAGIRQNLGITRDETLEHNMAKLGVRYEGHNYSDDQAIARRDKQEPAQ